MALFGGNEVSVVLPSLASKPWSVIVKLAAFLNVAVSAPVVLRS